MFLVLRPKTNYPAEPFPVCLLLKKYYLEQSKINNEQERKPIVKDFLIISRTLVKSLAC